MPVAPAPLPSRRKRWWLRPTNRKVVERYLCEARALISTHNQSDASAALHLVDSALSLFPQSEVALELKARSLLILRRYNDIADMLQKYIPSCYKSEEYTLSRLSCCALPLPGGGGSADLDAIGRAKLPSPCWEQPDDLTAIRSFQCFSISDLKCQVLTCISCNGEKEGTWRYLILGEACYHLGLLEDALVLLQTARRLASAICRQESNCLSDDSFSSVPLSASNTNQNLNTRIQSASQQQFEPNHTTQLLAHVKLFLRRKAAAHAALEAGLHSESVHHFSKIIDRHCGVPVPFVAACLVGRAVAYCAAGRLADAVSDCNSALSLDPSCIPALRTRAALFQALGALPYCLRDLNNLKRLFVLILCDGNLPGPPWQWPNQGVRHQEISSSLRAVMSRILELHAQIAAGEANNLDYYALLGVRHGCTRSELERAYLLLSLKHKPEKAIGFADHLSVNDYRDLDAVQDQTKMSASILYRMLLEGYLCILADISAKEEAEKQRAQETTQETLRNVMADKPVSLAVDYDGAGTEKSKAKPVNSKVITSEPLVYQGVSFLDLAVVGSLFSRPLNLSR